MPNERVVEIPWALGHLPQSGLILDVGSCDATYLGIIVQPDRKLHCLDPRDCRSEVPPGAEIFVQSIIGNTLLPQFYDAVLVLSTIEHIGLPHYGQSPFPNGDLLALAEINRLLKPTGYVLVSVPAGRSQVTSWYRQYDPTDLRRLFAGWSTEVTYWGYIAGNYQHIDEHDVEHFSYDYRHGADAVACIMARPQF